MLLIHALCLCACVFKHYLIVSLEVTQLLDLKEVSLDGEQRYTGVCEDGGGNGGQLQTVLLQPEHLQSWTPRNIRRQNGNLEHGTVNTVGHYRAEQRQQNTSWFRTGNVNNY